MVKSKEDTITKFNEQVNMTVGELESWLASDKSHKAGTGVGLESGRKIIEILKKNPDKDPDEYEERDLDHMHKVVGYINRHLAQEGHLKETKTKEELANTKSTISLKNWGHDPVKSLEEEEEAAGEVSALSDNVNEDPDVPKDDKGGGSRTNAKRKRDESEEAEIVADKKRRESTGVAVAGGSGGDEGQTARKVTPASVTDQGKQRKATKGSGRGRKSPVRKSARPKIATRH